MGSKPTDQRWNANDAETPTINAWRIPKMTGSTHPQRHPLEGEGNIIILLFIGKEGQATKADLERNLPVSQTLAFSATERLKNAGLIEEVKQETFPFSKILRPTEKGRAVAYHLAAIDSLLADHSFRRNKNERARE